MSNASQPQANLGPQGTRGSASQPPAISGRRAAIGLLIASLVMVALAAYGIGKRRRNDAVLAQPRARKPRPR